MDKPYSTEAYLLTATHNRIVDSIAVPKDKQTMKQKAKLPFPERKDETKVQTTTRAKMTVEEAEQRFSSVVIAEE